MTPAFIVYSIHTAYFSIHFMIPLSINCLAREQSCALEVNWWGGEGVSGKNAFMVSLL